MSKQKLMKYPFSVRLREDRYEMLRKLASELGIDVSTLVRIAIDIVLYASDIERDRNRIVVSI